jgi:selenocysteine lyase/cysteine desulfurase
MDTSLLFSHTKNVIYLNHASSSPLVVPVRERMKRLVDELELGDLDWEFWKKELGDFRAAAAVLLGVTPGEIGFITNTTSGLLAALYSIPFERGDNVVLAEDSFPSNRVPWFVNLPDVEKRVTQVLGSGSLEERLMALVDSRTKAIVVDWVDFFTGYRVDLKLLGDFCKEREIFLVVDGIQGCGAVSIDLSTLDVDFFAAASAKWLLGPVGAGILYVNKNTIPGLKPAFMGWMSLVWDDFNIFDPLPPLKDGAARFEAGSYPGLPLVGFVENLGILNSVGIEEINRKIFKLRKLLLDGLLGLDAEIISPLDESHASGILTFRLRNKESRLLWETLSQNNVKTSLRKNAIRLSPHFYNTEAEVQKVLEIVTGFAKSS